MVKEIGESPLRDRTPSLYARLSGVERRLADHDFVMFYKAIEAGQPFSSAPDIPLATRRAYRRCFMIPTILANPVCMVGGGVLALAAHRTAWLIAGGVILMTAAIQLIFAGRRAFQIQHYFDSAAGKQEQANVPIVANGRQNDEQFGQGLIK